MYNMSDVSEIVERTRDAARVLEGVLMRDGVTRDEVKKAAEPFDTIESELERLLNDG